MLRDRRAAQVSFEDEVIDDDEFASALSTRTQFNERRKDLRKQIIDKPRKKFDDAVLAVGAELGLAEAEDTIGEREAALNARIQRDDPPAGQRYRVGPFVYVVESYKTMVEVGQGEAKRLKRPKRILADDDPQV